MQIARVEGHVTSTVKHPSFQGWRLLICQPVDGAGLPSGGPVVAIDPYGAGLHETVIVSTDGAAARRAVDDNRSPVRHMIVGIVAPTPPRPSPHAPRPSSSSSQSPRPSLTN